MTGERDGTGDAQAGRSIGPGAGQGIGRLRAYANDFSTAFSLSEIELRFGQRFGPGEAVAVHTWIVTSPVHLVTFGRVIAATIEAYEDRFGSIPDAASDDATGDRTGR